MPLLLELPLVCAAVKSSLKGEVTASGTVVREGKARVQPQSVRILAPAPPTKPHFVCKQ